MDNNIYYHFFSYNEKIINALECGRIKVARFNELNDPFEMRPYRRFNIEERRPYDKIFQMVNDRWGLLCFSPNYIDQLLWAHYADDHKGIALGFKIKSKDLFDVKYTPNEIRTRIQLSKDYLENEKQYLELAKVKYKEWIYEKEHRILVNLKEDCIPDGNLFFVRFGKLLELKQLVLGSRFHHKSNSNKILDLKKKLNFKVIATRAGWEDYKIHECGTKTAWYR